MAGPCSSGSSDAASIRPESGRGGPRGGLAAGGSCARRGRVGQGAGGGQGDAGPSEVERAGLWLQGHRFRGGPGAGVVPFNVGRREPVEPAVAPRSERLREPGASFVFTRLGVRFVLSIVVGSWARVPLATVAAMAVPAMAVPALCPRPCRLP